MSEPIKNLIEYSVDPAQEMVHQTDCWLIQTAAGQVVAAQMSDMRFMVWLTIGDKCHSKMIHYYTPSRDEIKKLADQFAAEVTKLANPGRPLEEKYEGRWSDGGLGSHWKIKGRSVFFVEKSKKTSRFTWEEAVDCIERGIWFRCGKNRKRIEEEK